MAGATRQVISTLSGGVFAALAARLQQEPSVSDTVERVIRFAVLAVGCTDAGVALAGRSGLQVGAVTSAVVAELYLRQIGSRSVAKALASCLAAMQRMHVMYVSWPWPRRSARTPRATSTCMPRNGLSVCSRGYRIEASVSVVGARSPEEGCDSSRSPTSG